MRTAIFVALAFMSAGLVDATPSNTGDAWNLTPRGRWAYGPCQAVSTDRGITAAANGGYVQIWDLRNPAFPELKGQVAMPSIIEAIEFDGMWAYVANHYDGLQIVDASTPSAPRIYSAIALEGRAYDVAVQGDYAYVAADFAGLRIVDISNPRSPSEVGSFDTDGDARGICVEGDYAYIADNANGLVIVDISRPGKPAWVGEYDTPGLATDAVLAGRLAFVADGNNGVVAIDVATPASPVLWGTSESFLAFDIQVEGDVAFASSNMGLVTLDVSRGGTFPTLNIFDPGAPAYDIQLLGTDVFAACSTEGVAVIDVSSLPPSVAGSTGAWEFSMGVDVDGKYAYVANRIPGLAILDISDPDKPKQVGIWDTNDRAQSVVVEGDYAWVCDRFGGLVIINVATPSSPGITGGIDTPGWAYNVALNGETAYVADGATGGLRIIDVSPPLCCPTEIGSYDTGGEAMDVAVSGGYAYVADGGAGICVIDVDPPGSAHAVGNFEPEDGWASAVEIDGNYLYVANGNGGLLILDISTPDAPVEADEVHGGWTHAMDLKVVGDYVYVGDREFGVRVFYIADPTNALPVGSYDNGGRATGIAAAGNRVYLAEERIGVSILDFSPPPTATAVRAFDARAVGGRVELSWSVESDDALAGYRIYRSAEDGLALPVNPGALIAPSASAYADDGVVAGNTYAYTLVVVLEDGSGIPSPEVEVTVGATALALEQNVPNPFNPTTTITFSLPERGRVTLSVFDVTGRLVRTLLDGEVAGGVRKHAWDGTDASGTPVASGVYFCRLTAGRQTLTRRMVLLK